ncbi:hypothetical protein HW130_34790 [Streptomyces sp. PKU-EA00015]|uniref:hypothetical protein n=1 Tax=Streptomyces sp. PKU-EA00015 TaxID=2748326 RepID=UPI00159F990E|nr:hypothetical protein [Streptomyces sp. PKU-EA00015]NWF31326.1 hypothetical protein [Streptomyces sp. PKU-EA00015]
MPDPHLTDPDDAAELRGLLERSVPRPAAPADRMEQVRHRVRRRRQRTASAVAAGALAVTGLALWPGQGWFTQPPPTTPAATTPTVAAGHPVRFAAAEGLAMSLPEGWQAVAAPRASRSAVVYAATQRLDDSGATTRCTRDTARTWDVFSCAPLAALEPGAVVVALEPIEDPGATAATDTLTPAAAPGDGCRSLRGQLEYASAAVIPAERGHPALQVSICVAESPGTGESSPPSTRMPPSGTSTPDQNDLGTTGVTISPAGPATSGNPALKQAQTLLRTVRFG